MAVSQAEFVGLTGQVDVCRVAVEESATKTTELMPQVAETCDGFTLEPTGRGNVDRATGSVRPGVRLSKRTGKGSQCWTGRPKGEVETGGREGNHPVTRTIVVLRLARRKNNM